MTKQILFILGVLLSFSSFAQVLFEAKDMEALGHYHINAPAFGGGSVPLIRKEMDTPKVDLVISYDKKEANSAILSGDFLSINMTVKYRRMFRDNLEKWIGVTSRYGKKDFFLAQGGSLWLNPQYIEPRKVLKEYIFNGYQITNCADGAVIVNIFPFSATTGYKRGSIQNRVEMIFNPDYRLIKVSGYRQGVDATIYP